MQRRRNAHNLLPAAHPQLTNLRAELPFTGLHRAGTLTNAAAVAKMCGSAEKTTGMMPVREGHFAPAKAYHKISLARRKRPVLGLRSATVY